MPTSAQVAAQGFWIDDQGNIQRQPSKGSYGFRRWWEEPGRTEFKGALPMNYDWLKLDRPPIPRGPTMMTGGPTHELIDGGDPEYTRQYGRHTNQNRRAAPQPLGLPAYGHPGYHLGDVRTRSSAGATGEVGGTWPSISSPSGAQPRGTQFQRPGLPPAPRMLSYPGAVDTTATEGPSTAGGPPAGPTFGPPKPGFNPRRPGMGESTLGRIRSDLSDF